MSDRKLFFALWPDDRQRDRLRDAINSVARDVEGKAVDRRNWHITLAYIGLLNDEYVYELQERARNIQVEPFRLSFDRLEYWPRPKLAVLSAATVPAELQALVESLNTVFHNVRETPYDRTYRPHVTVSRSARPFSTERLAQRESSDWSGFELMESISEPGGVRYVPLKQ